MVDCARPRLHRPKHAFAPRSHTNQTSYGLDPNLYTRIDTIAPTPHANFGRGQLFPFIANPFTMLGHVPPPIPLSTLFFPTRAHTRARTRKTTTEDDDAATLHHTCILEFFDLLMLGFG